MGVGLEVVVSTMTLAVSLDVASCEVSGCLGLVISSPTLFTSASSIKVGMDASTSCVVLVATDCSGTTLLD